MSENAVRNEQYSRKNNLRVLGLEEEGEKENLEDKFIDAIEIIHAIGHRLNGNSNQMASRRNPRPVIVKFTSNKTKT